MNNLTYKYTRRILYLLKIYFPTEIEDDGIYVLK